MNEFVAGLVFLAPTDSDSVGVVAIVLVIWLLLINVDHHAQLSEGGRNKLALQRIDSELRTQHKMKKHRR